MRAFLGLDVPESVSRTLSGIRAKLKEGDEPYPALRWARSESLHLTVRFLGDIEESVADTLIARLRGSLRSFGPLSVEIDTVSWFPRRRPTVLAAFVAPSKRLTNLFEIVENDAVAVGLPAETRSPNPHITVARLRERGKRRLPEVREEVNAEFRCQELILFRSRLSPAGAQYAPLGEISF